jgi:hypothetical protein
MNAPLFCKLKYESEISGFVLPLFGCSRIARKECGRWYSSYYALRAVSLLEGCISNFVFSAGKFAKKNLNLLIPIYSGLIRVQNTLNKISSFVF